MKNGTNGGNWFSNLRTQSATIPMLKVCTISIHYGPGFGRMGVSTINSHTWLGYYGNHNIQAIIIMMATKFIDQIFLREALDAWHLILKADLQLRK